MRRHYKKTLHAIIENEAFKLSEAQFLIKQPMNSMDNPIWLNKQNTNLITYKRERERERE